MLRPTRFGSFGTPSGSRAVPTPLVAAVTPTIAGWQASLLNYQDIGVLTLLLSRGIRVVDREVRMKARARAIFCHWPPESSWPSLNHFPNWVW